MAKHRYWTNPLGGWVNMSESINVFRKHLPNRKFDSEVSMTVPSVSLRKLFLMSHFMWFILQNVLTVSLKWSSDQVSSLGDYFSSRPLYSRFMPGLKLTVTTGKIKACGAETHCKSCWFPTTIMVIYRSPLFFEDLLL